ncbi:ABC transporter permease [Leuconostoc mesenteroides]|uniref:ABC transporter permease n=1 Tax=Leuconostoc mesenteroides TaxID=1245 RepID=UPI00211448E3|nr:ABC transporter permease [Leuconostoc mesenteroides]UUE16974.1 ABC transporter permease [Leuconostoc mesenteroides]
MFKLIRLEMRKTNFKQYIIGGFIASLIIPVFLFFLLYIDKQDSPITNINFLFLVDSITRIVFIIFSGVLISRLIVEEYNDKTITLMFTYPISRKKIILSKLIIIIGFTLFFIVWTRLISFFTVNLLNNHFQFIIGEVTNASILKHFISTIIYDFSASGVALVPLFFGMKKRSTRTTIITAIIIAFFLGAGNADQSIGSFLIVPMTLTAIGLFTAYLSIHNIERTDVL